jgi:hypothetical protein
MASGARLANRLGQIAARLALVGAMASLVAACASSARSAGVPTPTATSTASPTATTVALAPLCKATQLTAAIERSGVAAGNAGTGVSLRNSSQQSCSLDGYPELVMLDASGQVLPTHVTDSPSAYVYNNLQPAMVVLAPDASAHFVLDWTRNPCMSAPTSSTLRITPPGAADTVTLTTQLSPCDGNLTTSPIVAQS